MNPAPEHAVQCPFCGSLDTELFSLFGQHLLTIQYYCNACRTPFERIKDDTALADATRHTQTDSSNAQNDM